MRYSGVRALSGTISIGTHNNGADSDEDIDDHELELDHDEEYGNDSLNEHNNGANSDEDIDYLDLDYDEECRNDSLNDGADIGADSDENIDDLDRGDAGDNHDEERGNDAPNEQDNGAVSLVVHCLKNIDCIAICPDKTFAQMCQMTILEMIK